MLAGSRRWIALAVAAAVALVVCWPVLAHPDTDGFPLSTYPMFSSRRSSSEPLSTVVGIDGVGGEHWLSPTLINGTSEVVQAAVVVDSEVAAGHADRLCADVAARVEAEGSGGRAGTGGDADGALQRVEVITVRYDAVRWFAGDHQPLQRIVHAACPLLGAHS